MLALLAPGSVVGGGGGGAASTFSSSPRIICCFPKPMPLKCMYRCSCCLVWNVIYPYFWFDRSFGFTVTFLFSSTNFPFFLFFRPFLFNFVEPSSVRKKHAYTHMNEPPEEWTKRSICSAAFHLARSQVPLLFTYQQKQSSYFYLMYHRLLFLCVHFSLHCCYLCAGCCYWWWWWYCKHSSKRDRLHW